MAQDNLVECDVRMGISEFRLPADRATAKLGNIYVCDFSLSAGDYEVTGTVWLTVEAEGEASVSSNAYFYPGRGTPKGMVSKIYGTCRDGLHEFAMEEFKLFLASKTLQYRPSRKPVRR